MLSALLLQSTFLHPGGDLNTCRPSCLPSPYHHQALWKLRSTPIDHVLHDALKNWVIAESTIPGGGCVSEAPPSDPLPTHNYPSGSPTTYARGWTRETPRSAAKTVRDVSKLYCVSAVLTGIISRKSIAERILFEILCMIAEELEDPPRDDFPITTSKLWKNRRLILMRNVCKTWKEQLLQTKSLWEDVCFNTTRRGTIEMAESFLDLMEKTPFNIYVTGSPEDLTGDSRVQLMARGLLLRLCRRVEDIRRYGFHTPSKELCAYLDLPSSKVSYLNLSGAREPGTFSGNFPVLHELYVPTSFFSSLDAVTFPTLTTFSLRAQATPTSLLWQ